MTNSNGDELAKGGGVGTGCATKRLLGGFVLVVHWCSVGAGDASVDSRISSSG
jgi:hypothetical protein